MTPTRPALRYFGGKWRIAPWIVEHLPPHRCYVEPFGGAASVLVRKARSYAEVYNDLDGGGVNLFRVLRDRGPELIEALRLTPFAREEFEAAYGPTDCELERARRLVILSFMGFGSNSVSGRKTGFRANSSRSGTTPAGDWANLPEAYPALVARLRGVVIENRDALAVMRAHDAPDTLHYLDPPYALETRGSERYTHDMPDIDQVRMLNAALTLQGMVIISGYETGIYDRFLWGWKKLKHDAFTDGARPRTECLWISPRAVAASRTPDLFALTGATVEM